MTQDESPGARDAGKRAGISEAERQERLTQLVLRRSKLSPDEAALVREVFDDIVAAHYDLVWNLLRKHGLENHEADDLLQEVFLTLHNDILEHGFVDEILRLLGFGRSGWQFGNHLTKPAPLRAPTGRPSRGLQAHDRRCRRRALLG